MLGFQFSHWCTHLYQVFHVNIRLLHNIFMQQKWLLFYFHRKKKDIKRLKCLPEVRVPGSDSSSVWTKSVIFVSVFLTVLSFSLSLSKQFSLSLEEYFILFMTTIIETICKSQKYFLNLTGQHSVFYIHTAWNLSQCQKTKKMTIFRKSLPCEMWFQVLQKINFHLFIGA